jgi:hypothetical protein
LSPLAEPFAAGLAIKRSTASVVVVVILPLLELVGEEAGVVDDRTVRNR